MLLRVLRAGESRSLGFGSRRGVDLSLVGVRRGVEGERLISGAGIAGDTGSEYDMEVGFDGLFVPSNRRELGSSSEGFWISTEAGNGRRGISGSASRTLRLVDASCSDKDTLEVSSASFAATISSTGPDTS